MENIIIQVNKFLLIDLPGKPVDPTATNYTASFAKFLSLMLIAIAIIIFPTGKTEIVMPIIWTAIPILVITHFRFKSSDETQEVLDKVEERPILKSSVQEKIRQIEVKETDCQNLSSFKDEVLSVLSLFDEKTVESTNLTFDSINSRVLAEPDFYNYELEYDIETNTLELVAGSISESKESIIYGVTKKLSDVVKVQVSLKKLNYASKGANNFKVNELIDPPFYYQLSKDDCGYALTCARRDLEMKLKQLAQSSNMTYSHNLVIGQLLPGLLAAKVLNSSQVYTLKNITHLLNKAVHGGYCEPACSKWLKGDWLKILSYLEQLTIQNSTRN